MDVEMDDKVELIEAKHGITGFGVMVKLYQKIYKEGYFIKITEETLLLLSKRINVDINKINDVINDCLKYDIFNDKLYKAYKILTSSGIQKRYLQAVDRRMNVELIKQYVIVDINGINVNINWINDGKSTQSKVKESKEEESKVKQQPPLMFSDLTEELKNEYPHVYRIAKMLLEMCGDVMQMKHPFSLLQLKTLIKKYGAELVEDVIKAMQNKGIVYLNKHGQYAYLTCEQWIKIRNK